jgi:hypothetical protein
VIWWINKFTSILPQAGKEAAVESSGSFISKIFAFIQKTFPPNSGSATRSYSWQEIIFAKPENMINNPIGIGIAISILIIIGLIAAAINYKKLVSKEKDYLLVSILWSFTAFMILNSMTFNLPFGLYSFRWWALFAFSASMLAAEGILLLFDFCKAFRVPKILILVIVILAVFFTSASQKYAVNTAVWPFGIGWTSSDEVRGYAWLKDNLPINTKIFAFSENNFVIGFDMYTCMWCKDITENRESSFNYTPSELNSWLKSKGYEYLIFDGRTVRKYSSNETNTKIQELLSSKLFNPVRSEPAMLLFKII